MSRLFSLPSILLFILSLNSLGQPPEPIVYLSGNEPSGTTVDDAVGSNNATATAGVARATGILGNALVFDSNSDYATLTSPITLSTGSYSFWIRTTGIADDMVVLGNNAYQSRIFVGASNNMKLETDLNGQEFANYTTLNLNTTYHYVITRSGDVVTFYRNGVSIGTQTIASSSPLTVSSIGYVNRSFRGWIDEIGIWNIALSLEDVQELYNSGSGLAYPWVVTPPPVIPDSVISVVNTIGRRPKAIMMGGNFLSYKYIGGGASPDPIIPPEDDFTGKVLYIDPISGSNTNNGLTEATPVQTLAYAQTLIDNSYDYIALADTAHYGKINFSSIVRTVGDPLVVTTWHKYGSRNASIKGLTQVTGWTQSGNYWTKTGLVGIPRDPNRLYNPAYIYTTTHLNGIYINGVWKGISKYPNTKTYYSIESTTSNSLTDNQGITSSNYWTGATLVSESPTWILGKYNVSSYSSSGVYSINNIWGDQVVATGMKYYLLNHRNAEDIDGEWTDNQSGGLEVYYTGNLSNQSVYVPLVDSVLAITNSSYITVRNVNFWGGNKEQIKIYNSTGTNINHCNFYRSPMAGIFNAVSTGTSCTYNNFYYPNDNGIMGVYNTGETYSNNYIRGAGVDGTFGGGRDGLHLNGIVTTGYHGAVNIKHNIIDSTGYCGISVLGGDNINTTVDVYRNYINHAMMVVSDGGGIYTYGNYFPSRKSIRGNLVTNTYNNSTAHRNYPGGSYVETRAIYMDEGYPNVGNTAFNRRWIMDSNYVYAYPLGLFQNSETKRIAWTNNTVAKAISYQTYFDYGYNYNTSGNSVDSARVTKNDFIAGYNTGGNAVYMMWDTWSSPTSERHNVIDSNDYYNPFGSDVTWLTNSGEPNWTRTPRNLATIRSSTIWEDNSTFNKSSWTFAQTSGITQDQFIWLIANWSSTSHTFNLGATVFKDLDGNTVSGTLVLPAYKAKVLFYSSGGVTGLTNPMIYR